MTNPVIYRAESDTYEEVMNIRRIAGNPEIQLSDCEKFFPGFSSRVEQVLYKGKNHPIQGGIMIDDDEMEPVAYFHRDNSGKTTLVAIGCTEQISRLLETV